MNKKLLFTTAIAAVISTSALMAQNWKTVGNSLTSAGRLGSTNAQDINFISNNLTRMSLTKTGDLNIASDQTAIQFPNPGATPKPMMFLYQSGSVNTSRMVFAYSPGFPDFGLRYTLGDRLDFLGGGVNVMNVDLAHKSVGIGTTNNENFKLKIVHGNNLLNGLAIENSTNPGIEWSLFTGAGNSPLNFIRDGALLGQISFPSGQYLALSDERLKTNIKSMTDVLGKIGQLKPSSYQFKNAPDKQEFNGFIAQDVMKIFPSLVSHTLFKENNADVYTMDYSGFGVIAIKGIQELMKINEEKDTKIDALQKQIDELKSIVMKNNQSNDASQATMNATLTDAALEQNTPNPFSNTTSVRYNLPQSRNGGTAKIVVTDTNGKTIKQVNISGAGKGVVNIDASMLTPGTYQYSLIVDGKIIGSKQMIVTK